jgi:NAD(P)-dependent dehydrogenase (short-subunit alcohol dehydrogenase family)
MFDLTDKVALGTGGGSGIGFACAEALIRHGARVMIGGRDQDKLKAAKDKLNSVSHNTGPNPACAVTGLDVGSTVSVEEAVRKSLSTFSRLDIVINSAGIMCKKPTFDLTPEEVNRVFDINYTGSLRVAQYAGIVFREQGSGCIINIASISSFVDLTQVAAYAASKNAVLGLTRSLANEWAVYGIRTNAIAPGFIPTELNRKMIEGTDRGRRILEHTPMARFGIADECAGAAVFLASPAARFVNGITLPVDGGYLASGISDAVAPWAQRRAGK